MKQYHTESFVKTLEEWNVHLSEKQVEQFLVYYELLTEWNKKMNLTAITEYDDVLKKHFLDSLALQRAYDLEKNQFVIDVGTGAGFPGIPLKIAFPHLQVVLLDSLNKRIGFLNAVIEKLGLVGISAVHFRAEDAARKKEYREQFDLCVSRAVANLSTLAEYGLPFVKTGGFFIPYKSIKVEEEVRDAKRAVFLLGGEIQDMFCYSLGDEMQRSFLLIRKKEKTSGKYPRKAGIPGKEPLK